MLNKEQIKLLEQINLLLDVQHRLYNEESELEEWTEVELETLTNELLGKDDNGSDD